MDASRRTSTLRRVATTASLAAFLVAPGAADAKKPKKPKVKSPVITSVKPMNVKVGGTLVIQGRNFRKGKGRNSVGFKRDGAAIVFLKSDLSTTRKMTVKLTSKLDKVLYGGPATFHLRVLAARFGKVYTAKRLSPSIAPKPVKPSGGSGGSGTGSGSGSGGQTPAGGGPKPPAACTVPNSTTVDTDGDLLSNALENKIGTSACDADSDNDGVSDGYEYHSAVDLNDDEYQNPNVAIPYPGARPYPNPLNKDANVDYDGDSLTLGEEYELWSNPKVQETGGKAGATLAGFGAMHLSYSDGLQYSVYTVDGSGRRIPALNAAGYGKQQQFLSWASSSGYATVTPPVQSSWGLPGGAVDIRDTDRNGTVSTGCGGEQTYYDFDCNGVLADDERDADADGLTNYDETHGRISNPSWWGSCYSAEAAYPVPYTGTDVADPDTDGDGIRDGADDQDHDDLPNLMELSRYDASGGLSDAQGFCEVIEGLDPKAPRHPLAYGKVQPFNPCDPDPQSRTCQRHPEFGTAADPDWWSLN